MFHTKLTSVICILFLIIACGKKILNNGNKQVKRENVLRILSYNIHHANPPSKPGIIDLDAIAKVIIKESPDVVGLQEVDFHTNRSGSNISQAAELSRLSGMPYYYFAKAINYDGGEYGLAILSRFPMSEMESIQLPTESSTKGELRTLSTAVIELPGKNKILFANTHLDAQRSDTNRYLQINKIVEILSREKLPVIITGDFNATPDSRIINILDQHFTRTCIIDCGFTIPENNPTKTIDFIAIKPSEYYTVKEHRVVDEKYASDHLPVIVSLEVLTLRKQ